MVIMMRNTKLDRTLEIFIRGLKGEGLVTCDLADKYHVENKTINRSIDDLRAFLADHRDLMGNASLEYSRSTRTYHLHMEEFLSSQELFAIVEVLIGARAFSQNTLTELTEKLKQFTTPADRVRLDNLIRKELFQYPEIKHDCHSLTNTLWTLIQCIMEQNEITIGYYRSDRIHAEHNLRPVSLLFNEYYFYLLAFDADGKYQEPTRFRVDRIDNITRHRTKFTSRDVPAFDEGVLRRENPYMWSGPLRKITFEYFGRSVQAVLDKIPTARILEQNGQRALIEAEVRGDGVTMWILSQGSDVKVLEPEDFAATIKEKLQKALDQYQ